MATKHTCVQGDSYAYDFSSTSIAAFDADWTGKWAIIDELGDAGTTLASGTMLASTDESKMELRILPTDTAIALGVYKLIAEITNASISFNKEVMQDQFTITAQGISPA